MFRLMVIGDYVLTRRTGLIARSDRPAFLALCALRSKSLRSHRSVNARLTTKITKDTKGRSGKALLDSFFSSRVFAFFAVNRFVYTARSTHA